MRHQFLKPVLAMCGIMLCLHSITAQEKAISRHNPGSRQDIAAMLPSLNNDNWESSFSLPGADNTVRALTAYGSIVYIGGTFLTVERNEVNYIAKWDGSSWSSLGSGMNSTVNCLAVDGSGTLYAGGSFTQVDGETINRIAKWNGSTWESLGTGMNGTVNAVIANGTDVYAGGSFTDAGGNTAHHIAKWDGSAWSALDNGGNGTNGDVYAMCMHGTNLYIGGDFTDQGYHIACWDGTTWDNSYFASGVNDIVWSMDMLEDTLYAGGDFTEANSSIAADRIARWDPDIGWASLSNGVSHTSTASAVNAVFCNTSDNTVIIGGVFEKAGGTTVNNLAQWDGTAWSGYGTGTDNRVMAVLKHNGLLYAGGYFSQAGTKAAIRIASWDGSQWSAMTSMDNFGINGTVNTITNYNSNIYIGGIFSTAGAVVVNNIAVWDGSNWSALGDGVDNGTVNCMTTDTDGTLYIGGSFTEAGGSESNAYLAKWDGSSWSSVGGGVDNTVRALAIYQNKLYVAGDFMHVGAGAEVPLIACWDGSSWSWPDNGVDNVIYSLVVKEDTLFAGGVFTTAGNDNSIQYIAKYDGSSWAAVGGGVNNGVGAMSASGSYLFVAGSFTSAGGSAAQKIALWNGSAWSAMGSGTTGEVKALAASGNTCYAGGTFSSIGAASAANVAKWDGTAWTALGDGTDAEVKAICLGSLYAGGGFERAGGKISYGLAKWTAESYSVRVETKLFLEGPYSTVSGEMSTALCNDGLIPSTAPYSNDPRTAGVPSDIVDWVLVSLRVTPDGAAVARKSAFLRKDGCVVGDDGSTPYITLNAAEGDYYIVIEHRNHLAVMSKTAQALLSASSVLYDFTAEGTQYFLTDGATPDMAAKQMSDNSWALFSGDIDQNGFITAADMNLGWRPDNGTYGYKASDVNLDTFINAHDKRQFLIPNNEKYSQVQ